MTVAEVMAEFGSRLRFTAARVIGEDHADDVIQDVMVILVKHLGQYRGESRLYTWLSRITLNCAYDRSNRLRKRPSKEHAYARSELIDMPPDSQLSFAELESGITKAIGELPDAWRNVLVRVAEGQRIETVAADLGKTVQAAKNCLHRARHRVRERIEAFV